ncbi:ABC transporter ATP-binding protein [Clostridium botulinum]|uniref:ATP-binding cassette domain-containing protein n=1 Tax=Clostridium botulinum TaxID=1491 RepID=A0A846JCZ4_CLOBO|nr:ATP-binding cassette domain-containing protein [Clostridium botulinum]ACA55475.1 ABC transporter, ATP-binding protein [Clostridium botulinum A3 str. Loch Maree]KEJ00562.1 ABC transporter ATP-binding protein [Clostridium botulinum A2B7 92]NFH67224.1 ATP-binding cassette domain-containing protein [Clostridium botulinum]NFJ09937.1 ATP-binding cassette domain-containing protein [Clostridium botulinum]NFK16999.1 ATP-binding cassette domain-containing protein [Clostridium botulinum]
MLQIQNLHKVFNKGTLNENNLFNNLNLDVKAGDFITIIGSNGAGKSTLLNIISGSIKPDQGKINLEDKDITFSKEYEVSKYIGRVFQDPSKGTAPSMTILENMSMAENKGKRFGLTLGINKKKTPNFIEILKELNLGLEDKLNVTVGALSGGQRQALSLIMTAMNRPKVLLLDEHTAALDPKTSKRIIEITEKIIEEEKITALMVTHDLNQAINVGNRLIMMHKGKVVLDIKGEEKKSLTKEKLLKCFENLNIEDGLSDRTLFS